VFFGPGETYQQTVNAVTDQSKSELTRAYAASALGEFWKARAFHRWPLRSWSDSSPVVRLAAANALIPAQQSGPEYRSFPQLSRTRTKRYGLAALNGRHAHQRVSKVDSGRQF